MEKLFIPYPHGFMNSWLVLATLLQQ